MKKEKMETFIIKKKRNVENIKYKNIIIHRVKIELQSFKKFLFIKYKKERHFATGYQSGKNISFQLIKGLTNKEIERNLKEDLKFIKECIDKKLKVEEQNKKAVKH